MDIRTQNIELLNKLSLKYKWSENIKNKIQRILSIYPTSNSLYNRICNIKIDGLDQEKEILQNIMDQSFYIQYIKSNFLLKLSINTKLKNELL